MTTIQVDDEPPVLMCAVRVVLRGSSREDSTLYVVPFGESEGWTVEVSPIFSDLLRAGRSPAAAAAGHPVLSRAAGSQGGPGEYVGGERKDAEVTTITVDDHWGYSYPRMTAAEQLVFLLERAWNDPHFQAAVRRAYWRMEDWTYLENGNYEALANRMLDRSYKTAWIVELDKVENSFPAAHRRKLNSPSQYAITCLGMIKLTVEKEP